MVTSHAVTNDNNRKYLVAAIHRREPYANAGLWIKLSAKIEQHEGLGASHAHWPMIPHILGNITTVWLALSRRM